MMGGGTWVERELGGGSAFHFTARFDRYHEPVTQAAPLDLENMKDLPVLVVDDNATNRRILEEVLTNWRMKPTVVDRARAALSALERARDASAPFALVLTDGRMPEMDGFELAEQIRQHPELARATIMMLSSDGQRGDAARCRELGV